jgi:hypothetical protein
VPIRDRYRDLGLSYMEAAHGVQSAVAVHEARGAKSVTPKHLRTGINLAMVEHGALVSLLVDKGLITVDEYEEYLRLATNDELAREQDTLGVTLR